MNLFFQLVSYPFRLLFKKRGKRPNLFLGPGNATNLSSLIVIVLVEQPGCVVAPFQTYLHYELIRKGMRVIDPNAALSQASESVLSQVNCRLVGKLTVDEKKERDYFFGTVYTFAFTFYSNDGEVLTAGVVEKIIQEKNASVDKVLKHLAEKAVDHLEQVDPLAVIDVQ